MSDEANPNVDDDVAVVARGRGCCKQVGRRLEVEPQEDWRSIMGAPGGVICIGTGGGGATRAAVATPNEAEGRLTWEGAPTDLTSLGNTMQ